jgi:hypothetical protein
MEDLKQTSGDNRQPWTTMRLTDGGRVNDVVKMPGGGKLSLTGGDPGDPRKPKGQG